MEAGGSWTGGTAAGMSSVFQEMYERNMRDPKQREQVARDARKRMEEMATAAIGTPAALFPSRSTPYSYSPVQMRTVVGSVHRTGSVPGGGPGPSTQHGAPMMPQRHPPVPVRREVDPEKQREREEFGKVGSLATEAAHDEDGTALYEEYKPQKLKEGIRHPDAVIETASLASIVPPDITYQHHLGDVVTKGTLSSLQVESIVYANMKFQQRLPDSSRAGFFLGDGAGVGKGRQMAGNILEHFRSKGGRVLWVSSSTDLRLDAMRDLKDLEVADATGIAEESLYPKDHILLPLGDLQKHVPEDFAVIFCTYSFLISGSPTAKSVSAKVTQGDKETSDAIIGGKKSRAKQLLKWLRGGSGPPMLIFDECHKAKNLASASGAPTKTARIVQQIQKDLPEAKVLYCSATGASEPGDLAYMHRLGSFGYENMHQLVQAITKEGVSGCEIASMGLKASGCYLSRTLSFTGSEFHVHECTIDDNFKYMYDRSCEFWQLLLKTWTETTRLLSKDDRGAVAKVFWGAHQRFFKLMLMASKVEEVAKMSKEALENDEMCVVVGLQSTGESAINNTENPDVNEDELISAPKMVLSMLLRRHFPDNGDGPFINQVLPPNHPSLQRWQQLILRLEHAIAAWQQSQLIHSEEIRILQESQGTQDKTGAKDEEEEEDDIVCVDEKTFDEIEAEKLENAKRTGFFIDLDEPLTSSQKDTSPTVQQTLGSKRKRVSTTKRNTLSDEAVDEEAPLREAKLENAGQEAPRRVRRSTANYETKYRDDGEEIICLDDVNSLDGDEDPNDDICDVCGQAGELILCDTCPKAFHLSCIGLDKTPEGDWMCLSCVEDPTRRNDPNHSGRAVSNGGARPVVKKEPVDWSDDSDFEEDSFVNEKKVVKDEEEAHSGGEEDDGPMDSDFYDGPINSSSTAIWRIKSLLLEGIEVLSLPPNPLDDLIDRLGGSEHVAEMTGRSVKQVKVDGKVKCEQRKTGSTGERNAVNIRERKAFMDGKKLVAIISEASSSGVSLHADRRVPNQRRRLHLTWEIPWSAERTVQQLGRSLRSNQSSAPVYKLLVTELAGEKRFASAAATRLRSLGAILKADRNAMRELGLNAFDINTGLGSKALDHVIKDIKAGTEGNPNYRFLDHAPLPGVKAPRLSSNQDFYEFARENLQTVGLNLRDYNNHRGKKKVSVNVFLNRLLGICMGRQEIIFQYFSNTFEAVMEDARLNNEYVDNIADIRGKSINPAVGYPQTVHTCRRTGAKTELMKVNIDNGTEFEKASDMLNEFLASMTNLGPRIPTGFYMSNFMVGVGDGTLTNKRKEHLVLMAMQRKSHMGGLREYRVVRPSNFYAGGKTLLVLRNGYHRVEHDPEKEGYDADKFARLKALWEEAYVQSYQKHWGMVQNRIKTNYILSGAVLNVFKIVMPILSGHHRSQKMKHIVRVTLDEGRTICGLDIPEQVVSSVMTALQEAEAVDENVNKEKDNLKFLDSF